MHPQPTVTTWNIDPAHTTVEFKVRHMMITNVKGQFTGVTGVLTLDEQDTVNHQVAFDLRLSLSCARDACRCNQDQS